MTTPIKLTISDELAARIDQERGLLSRQEYIVNAVVKAVEGRDTVEGLLRRLLDNQSCVSSKPATEDTMLSFD